MRRIDDQPVTVQEDKCETCVEPDGCMRCFARLPPEFKHYRRRREWPTVLLLILSACMTVAGFQAMKLMQGYSRGLLAWMVLCLAVDAALLLVYGFNTPHKKEK